ncbi:APC family permease [Weissella paramesenteroides]|uniref:APC family permease n=1 Tax=Weissella paramesenteroides TaxID=1249 RepID=UPI0021AFD0C6|nr:amino acid permease [Weissella paramesenteroides]MCS9983873.1 amino acid permease [Weissella paramesenteroides]MCS9997796.1 amino acid permease [Weissella paramesenteroides]MCT0259847.1 amino acid permease [Weissella paramesenteroides]MCT0486197.1 amino acid permease [Weissella paramesenteroides]
MSQLKLWQKMIRRENPSSYADKDGKLQPVLGKREMIAMGIGTVVGAGVFTMPGIVAAEYAGPAVVISFVIAALIAGLSALAYSELASAMPFAGSIYSWANVIFGEFIGWIAGWAILAEYLIALALVSSAWSSYFQGFLASFGFELPKFFQASFNLTKGTGFDLFGAIAILVVGVLASRGLRNIAQIENWLVVGKIAVIIIFIVVGATAVQVNNWLPFIPHHQTGTHFGGITGIIAGATQIFFSYIGFDTIAANSAEVKNPQKTMPQAIVGTLVIATALFVGVAAILTGMYPYEKFAGNAEPAAWALRESGHLLTANLLSVVALVGMFSGLVALLIGGSRLVYSFGRDGLMPRQLAQLDNAGLPKVATGIITAIAIILGGVFPIDMLANLVSAGTLIAFIVAGLAVLKLRKRADINHSGYKMPWYPVLPILAALAAFLLLCSLNTTAIYLTVGWLVIGFIVYLFYGSHHS